MRLEVVTRPERLAAAAPHWEALLATSRDPQPTMSPWWQLAWWDVFGGAGSGRELRAGLIWEGEQLVGVAPLLARNVWVGLGVRARRLELLASGEDEHEEICSEYLGIVAHPALEQRVVRTLSAGLVDGAFGPWDELIMPEMSGRSATPTLLSAELSQEMAVSFRMTGGCPYITLPGRWDQYLAALSGSGRYLVRRSVRDFELWAAGDFKLHHADTPANLRRGRQILESLHGERWKAAGDGGVFSSERFRAFHDRVMSRLFERRELELLWLEVRGEPIAVVYNLVHDGKVYFYQGGRRMDVPKQIRPGIVLHAYAIRRAIEKGWREYDFLGGGARYKLDMALDSRPLYRLEATRNAMLSRIRIAAGYALNVGRRLRDQARARFGTPGPTPIPLTPGPTPPTGAPVRERN